MEPLAQIGYRVMLVSSIDYEEITAEVYFDGKFAALINCENGLDRLELELPGLDLVQERIVRRVDLAGFLDAVDYASKWLRNELP